MTVPYGSACYPVHILCLNHCSEAIMIEEDSTNVVPRGRQTNSFKICKFLGSFRYHKSANFLGVPVRKIFIVDPQFLQDTQNTAQLMYKFKSSICYFCKDKKYCMYLRTCRSLKSASHKRFGPKIRKVSHLRKVRKSNKLFVSPEICDL
jgi:hypothetical protein